MSFKDRMKSKTDSSGVLNRAKTFRIINNVKYNGEPVREDRETGRVYITPAGEVYPSVTTILGEVGDKSWLQNWRDRIGESAADKILKQSGRRGTKLHWMAEQYIKNEDNYLEDATPVYLDLFRQVKMRIDESLGYVGGIETGLYSDKLKIAGTADLIAEWDGKTSVVDWKNARYFKKLSDIHGYLYQTNMYARMFEERTGIPIHQLVVVMAVENNTEAALVFKEKRKDWDEATDKIIEEYYATHS